MNRPDIMPLVTSRNGKLALERNSAELELNRECFLVYRLQKARTQMPVHLYRRPDHLSSK
jgi:hypothetical protein